LRRETRDLAEALGLRARDHVALVGGGGKTTVMFALADQLKAEGSTVLTSTTTKVWEQQAQKAPSVILEGSGPQWKEELVQVLDRHHYAFVAGERLASGKLQGISPTLADRLFRDRVVDYLILEADGAAGRPVKAPARYEPVIPRTATVVVAMAGLEALGKPCTDEWVFRAERFMELTGARQGEFLKPVILARLLQHQRGLFQGCPKGARRIIFLNKVDLVQDRTWLDELVGILAGKCRLVLGSVKEGIYQVHR